MKISYFYVAQRIDGKPKYSIRRKIERSAVSVDNLGIVFDDEVDAIREVERLESEKDHMKDWSLLNRYYDELMADIYPQPPDRGHSVMTKLVIDKWIPKIQCTTVLDVGCGEAFAQEMFEEHGLHYTGISFGDDFRNAKAAGRRVYPHDMHFLPYEDGWFDLIFARHVLEHSPMPLLALMEWHRVSANWLALVLPTPQYWGTAGRNHYSVMDLPQAEFLLQRSGWNPIWHDHTNEMELRFLCEKQIRRNPYYAERNEDAIEESTEI